MLCGIFYQHTQLQTEWNKTNTNNLTGTFYYEKCWAFFSIHIAFIQSNVAITHVFHFGFSRSLAAFVGTSDSFCQDSIGNQRFDRKSLDRMIYGVKQIIFVVGDIWSGLIVAYGHAVIMCLWEFTAKSNVVDASIVTTKVRREMKWQMMNWWELNWPTEHHIKKMLWNEISKKKTIEISSCSLTWSGILSRHLGSVRAQTLRRLWRQLHQMTFSVGFWIAALCSDAIHRWRQLLWFL